MGAEIVGDKEMKSRGKEEREKGIKEKKGECLEEGGKDGGKEERGVRKTEERKDGRETGWKDEGGQVPGRGW